MEKWVTITFFYKKIHDINKAAPTILSLSREVIDTFRMLFNEFFAWIRKNTTISLSILNIREVNLYRNQIDFKNYLSHFWHFECCQFDDTLLWLCNTVNKQNAIEKLIKDCILTFSKKCDLGIAKIDRGMTIITIDAKVYNALFLNYIQRQVEKNQSNHWRSTRKKSRGNTSVRKYF